MQHTQELDSLVDLTVDEDVLVNREESGIFAQLRVKPSDFWKLRDRFVVCLEGTNEAISGNNAILGDVFPRYQNNLVPPSV